MALLMAHHLIRLMALAGQDDHIPRLGVVHGVVDRLDAVLHHDVRRLRADHAIHDIRDNSAGLLCAGVI